MGQTVGVTENYIYILWVAGVSWNHMEPNPEDQG